MTLICGMTPRGEDVALEHLAVAAERGDALLDARAAGVEQADDRRARLHRHVLHLDDLLRVGSRERAAEHGEILGEDEDGAAVDRAPAGDHAVAGDLGLLHAEVVGAVLDEHVELLERALVEQQLDALARGELAALVLGLDARLAAARRGPGRGAVPACRGCLSCVAGLPHIARQKPYHGGGPARFLHASAYGLPCQSASGMTRAMNSTPEQPKPRSKPSRRRLRSTARASTTWPCSAISRSCSATRSNIDALYYVADDRAAGGPARGRHQGDCGARSRSARRRPALHNLLGQAHLRLNQDDEALASFDARDRDASPAFADAYGNRANAAVRDGPARPRRLPTSTARWRLRPDNAGGPSATAASVLADLGRLERGAAPASSARSR